MDTDDFPPEPPAPSATPVGHVDLQEHSPTRTLLTNTIHRTDISGEGRPRAASLLTVPFADSNVKYSEVVKKEHDIKFETLRSYDQDSLLEMDASHISGQDHSMDSHEGDQGMHTMMVTPELMGMLPGASGRLGPAKSGSPTYIHIRLL